MKIARFVCLVFVLMPSFVSAQIDFKTVEYLKGLGTPVSMVVGDFDGDGKEDALVNTEPVSLMFAFYANGLNSYEKKEFQLTSGKWLSPQVLVSDLNNDGKDDLVIIDQFYSLAGSKLRICLSTGRDFTNTSIDIENPVNQLGWKGTVVDFDDDGNQDILLLGGGQPVNVYNGDGNGNFERSELSEVTGEVSGNFDFYVTDLNNDEQLDMVVINDNLVTTFIKNGAGYSKTDLSYEGRIMSTMQADFNGDGAPELVLITYSQMGHYAVTYFKNEGNGVFASPFSITGSTPWTGLDHADYDDDGKEDILYGAINGPYAPILLHNLGNDNFEEKHADGDMGRFNIASGFINSDGIGSPEIFVASAARGVHFYKYDGTKYEYDGDDVVTPTAYDGDAYDLDNDGNKDIVAASLMNGAVVIWYGKGDLDYEDLVIIRTPYRDVVEMEVADFNNDGYGDFAIAIGVGDSGGNVGTFLYLSTGARTYDEPVELGSSPQEFLIASDVNNDDDIDLIAARSLFTNDGNGNFSMTTYPFGASYVTAATGYFDNDAFIDVFLASPDEKYLALNNGTGGFKTPVSVAAQSPLWSVISADLNNDGFTDVIGTEMSNGFPSKIDVLLNMGSGNFSETSIVPEDGFGFTVKPSAKDVDLDGLIDIVAGVSNSEATGIAVMLAKPDGFNNDLLVFPTKNPEIKGYAYTGSKLVISDMNNDLKPDVVILSLNGPAASILPSDLVLEPEIIPGDINVAPDLTTAFITLTKGNGDGRIIVVRKEADEGITPVDGTFYSDNETYIVLSGEQTTATAENLLPNTTYVVTAHEFNINDKNNIINYTTDFATATFTTKKIQIITVNADIPQPFEGEDFVIDASSNAGMPLAITLLSGNGALNDNVYTPNYAGSIHIQITAEANEEYGAASIEFWQCIFPHIPSISMSDDLIPTLTSSRDSDNVWEVNGTLIPDATEKIYTPKEDGIYRVAAVVDECAMFSEPTPYIIAGVKEDLENRLSLSPNPAKDLLRVDVPLAVEPVFLNSIGEQFSLPFSTIDQSIEFDISKLPVGFYVLKIQNQSLKFLKQ